MYITSAYNSTSFWYSHNYENNLTSFTIEDLDDNEFINSTITTTLTTTVATTTTSNILFRLFDSTRLFSLPRSTLPLPSLIPTTSSSLLNKYFLFKSPFNRSMRIVELCILSLTLPVYIIVFILFIELSVQRISSNTTISGGGSRSRSQRRRQRMRSLIWTSNYLLVDFLGLLYELIYVIIHLTGDLALNSFIGRFYCQLQVYLPLYLTALMAYSLTAISVYRRRHFLNLHNQTTRTTSRTIFLITILWIMPIITSILPAYFLTYLKILRITQHETTNACQISYTYGSNIVAIYMCYRLGNIFLLPLSISFICYLTICIDLLRMQRRFSRAFKRHVHIRKNLILQILFLFLNFAVFWLPAEIITLYTKNRRLKDTFQVTKSLNILLDPIIIAGFDTRFSSAAEQLLSRWRLEEFLCLFNPNRATPPSTASVLLISSRSKPSIRRLKHPTLKRLSRKHPREKLPSPQQQQQQTPTVKWNLADENDITVLEAPSNHVSALGDQRRLTRKSSPSRRKQQQQQQQPRRRRSSQSQIITRRRSSTQMRVKKSDNRRTKKK